MSFTLPALKYEKTALGFISENTLNFHHGKHLQTYIDTTNKLVAGSNYEGKSLLEIMTTSSGPLFNNAAQSWNHEFYFNCISPETKAPSDKVLALINENFESLDDFKQKYIKMAQSLYLSRFLRFRVQIRVQTGKEKGGLSAKFVR